MANNLQGSQVTVSDVSFHVAEHKDLCLIPDSGWSELPFESIGSFGATFTTAVRTNTGKTRGAPKSSITGLTSPFEYTDYMTFGNLRKFVPAMLYSQEINSDVMDLEISQVSGTPSNKALTLKTALTSDQISRFKAGTLLQISGARTVANNKLVRIKSDVSTGTSISIDDNGLANVTEDARVSFAGYRRSGTGLNWGRNGNNLTLTETGIGTLLRGLNLREVQSVYIGSPNAARTDYINGGVIVDGVLHGSARVVTMSENQIIFDHLLESLAGAPTAPAQTGTIDILFSTSSRDVARDSDEFCERAFAFTQETLGLDDGTGTSSTHYEVTTRQFPNTLALNLVDEGLSTMVMGFSGSDTTAPSKTAPGGLGDSAVALSQASYSTSTDIGRLTVQGVDEVGLTTDYISATANLNNNITGRRVLGLLGPKFQNLGNFEASIAAEVLFTSPLIPNAIRNLTTVGNRLGMQNDDGVFFLDFPAATLDGGGRTYPVNDSVTISTGINAHEDDRFDKSQVVFSTIAVPLLPPEQQVC